MRLHEAVWVYAEQHGNDYAREYATLRKILSRYSVVEQKRLMLLTPDDSFPEGSNGILDGRNRYGQTKKKATRHPRSAATSNPAVEMKSPNSNFQSKFHAARAKLQTAKSKYHSVMMTENLLSLNTGYNQGNMSGVIHSIVGGVQHAILYARSNDKVSNPDDAYAAVATHVSDVLASAIGISRFEPEPLSSDELPSAKFAKARIDKAFGHYQLSRREAEQLSGGIDFDLPSEALLESTHSYFGDMHLPAEK
ncbi:Cleavage induced protein [Phytophthora megakarya]|uniref:Cleavage induced protein n=1 Tax=Phytophthora megakarya TaxID=4795 RepID=A0A225UZ50_9STRA|nr:Cleavage induced protein [Phytophthora megakarya]